MNNKRKILLEHKFIRIIEELSKDMPLRKSMDILYRSQTYKEIISGISDMHCRSDKYLAEELLREADGVVSFDYSHKNNYDIQ
ncbi:hypothetical protein FACS1894187_01430 [Synergistales bacterium]|nr:hypothetical protein FACS1894187_01430 [Synergistales bacterium]